jgi:hypothetical protein
VPRGMQFSGLFVPGHLVAAKQHPGTFHPGVAVQFVQLALAFLVYGLDIPLILWYGSRGRRFGERGGGLCSGLRSPLGPCWGSR